MELVPSVHRALGLFEIPRRYRCYVVVITRRTNAYCRSVRMRVCYVRGLRACDTSARINRALWPGARFRLESS